MSLKNLATSDPRELEDLRRMKGSGSQDHLASRCDQPLATISGLDIHARRAIENIVTVFERFEDDPFDYRVGQDRQIAATSHLQGQIGRCSGRPGLCDRINGSRLQEGTNTGRTRPWVRSHGKAEVLKRAKPRGIIRSKALTKGHGEGPSLGGRYIWIIAPGQMANLLGILGWRMGFDELSVIWGQRIVVPAFLSQGFPGVDAGLARVDHHEEVERGASPEHATSRLGNGPAVELGLGPLRENG